VSEGPSEISFGMKHFVVDVGIGKDHTASIYIDEEALKELRG